MPAVFDVIECSVLNENWCEKERMDLKRELQRILQTVGMDSIWRPVCDAEGNLMANGVGLMNDGLREDFPGVHFRGKTVVDLGCNFGFYTFLAKRLGARKVVGIDVDERIVRGCNILKAMHGVSDVHFYAADFTTYQPPEMYDLAMLIDVIGKDVVQTGSLTNLLDAMERFAEDEMILSLRPIYRIPKHFDISADTLVGMYSGAPIRNDRFHLLEYVQASLRENWETAYLSPECDPDNNDKRTILFVRKGIQP